MSLKEGAVSTIGLAWICVLAVACGSGSAGQTDGGDDEDSGIRNGSLVWAIGFGGNDFSEEYQIGFSTEMGSAIVALPDGSSVVGGSFVDQMTLGKGEPGETTLDAGAWDATAIFLARFREDGRLEWGRAFGAYKGVSLDTIYGSYVSDIVVLDDGSLAVIGHFEDGTVFGQGEPTETTLEAWHEMGGDGFVARYEADGSFAWVRHLKGLACLPGDYGGPCFGAALEGGNLVVVGAFEGEATIANGRPDAVTVSGPENEDLTLAGFGPKGDLLWTRTMGRSPSMESIHAVKSTGDGGFFISGKFEKRNKSDDTTTLGYGETNETVIDCGFFEPKPQSGDGYCVFEFLARYKGNGELVFAKPVAEGTLGLKSGMAVSPESVVLAGALPGGYIMAPTDADPVRITGDDEHELDVVARFSTKGDFIGMQTGRGAAAQAAELLPDGSVVIAGHTSMTRNDVVFGEGASGETTIAAADCSLEAGGCAASFAARFSGDGSVLWAHVLGSRRSEGFSDQGNDLAVLPSGRIAIIGNFSQTSVFGEGEPHETALTANGKYDIFLALYEP
ncbi:MAG: hypothetical protein PHU25_10690 [Deltaproteobacteria bacterium]|nr:hypothetical protein [Deltaproteobacteria bacterium]